MSARGRGRGGRGNSAADPASSPPSHQPTSPLAHFQAARLAATANGTKFLDMAVLTSQLHQRFTSRLPSEVFQAVNALQRMLQEVSSSIDAAIATHHVLTLHDLQALVLSSNDAFKDAASFDALMLGPLTSHPKLKQHYSAEALRMSPPPPIKSVDVMQYIAKALEESWDAQEGKAERLDVKEVLAGFATQQGYATLGGMGILVRSHNFVTGLIARCLGARRRAEKTVERGLESQRQMQLKLHQREMAQKLQEELAQEARDLENEIAARQEARRRAREEAAADANAALEEAAPTEPWDASARRALSLELEKRLREVGADGVSDGPSGSSSSQAAVGELLWDMACVGDRRVKMTAQLPAAAQSRNGAASSISSGVVRGEDANPVGGGGPHELVMAEHPRSMVIKVHLHKPEPTARLGIELQTRGESPVVTALAPGCIAIDSGLVAVGQRLLAVNGAPVTDHETATSMLRSAMRTVELTLLSEQPSNGPAVQGMAPIALEGMPPVADPKQSLGEDLFPLVAAVVPPLADKITGMLLELENDEVRQLMRNAEALRSKIIEAVAVLDADAKERAALGTEHISPPWSGPEEQHDERLHVSISPQGLLCDAPRLASGKSKDQWIGGRFLVRQLCERFDGAPPMGRLFFEMTVLSGLARVGWSCANHSSSKNLQLGADRERLSFGYGGTGMKSSSGVFQKYGQAYGAGDVIGCALDCTGQMWSLLFYKNGHPLGEAVRLDAVWRERAAKCLGTPHPVLCPAICLQGPCTVVLNFGLRPFKGAPPDWTNHSVLQALRALGPPRAGGTLHEPPPRAGGALHEPPPRAGGALHRLLTGAIPSLLCRALSNTGAPDTAMASQTGAGTRGTAVAPSEGSLLEHIHAILSDIDGSVGDAEAAVDRDSALVRLGATERELLVQRRVRRFEDLGMEDRSFLSFCARHASHFERIVSTASEARSSRRAEALDLACRILDAMPSMTHAALCSAMCEHFRVSFLSALGWPTIEDLYRCATAAAPAAPPLIPCACLLALLHGQDGSGGGPASLDVATAERAVLSTPLLVDIAAHTQWHHTFGPQLGVSLRDFLADSARPDTLRALETSCSCFVRLEVGTLASFRSAVAEMQPVRAAAIATYLCLHAGGVAHAPLALCFSYTERELSSAPDRALRFCLCALAALPPPLLPSVGKEIFLAAAKSEPEALRKLLQMAREPIELQALHRLGHSAGVVEFAQHFLAFQPQPLSPLDGHTPPLAHLPLPAQPVSALSGALRARDDNKASSESHATEGGSPQVAGAVATPLKAQPLTGTAGAADVRATEASDACIEICARIGVRFGEGLDTQLDSGGKESLEQLRAVTMRSIQRLAAELYGGNVHFVLELIQNAECAASESNWRNYRSARAAAC